MSSRWPTHANGSGGAGSAKAAVGSGRPAKDSTGRIWTQKGDWCLTTGPWRIAKSIVCGKARYTLTHEARLTRWCGIRTHEILGVFSAASEAMEAAK